MSSFKLYLALILISTSFAVFSQKECQDKIDQANKLFDDGLFRDAEKIARQTLDSCELNKVQEDELIKLMAAIYYEMDELELGDQYAMKFVKKNPYYVASKRNDPLQFRYATQKLVSFPRISPGIRLGAPFGRIITKKVFPILDSADYLQDYIVKPIFNGGIELALNLNKYISINLGSGIRMQKIQHQVPFYNQIIFNYTEQYAQFTFPVSIGIMLPMGSKFSTQLYAGAEFERLFSAKYSYNYSGTATISPEYSSYLSKSKSKVEIPIEYRMQKNTAMMGGAKILYKIEKFNVFVDVRYQKALELYNNPDKRYADQDLYFSNNYNLADIMVENIEVSVGIMYNLFYKVKSKYQK